jgi:hypothetical protein
MTWRRDIEVQSPGQRRMIGQELRQYPHLDDAIELKAYQYSLEPTVTVHMTLATWTLISETMNDRERHHQHPTVRDAYEQYQMTRSLVRRNYDE